MTSTRISEDMTINGDLTCSGPLEVWGRIDGDINAARLEIMNGGRVSGNIEADELVVRGEHVGSAFCSAVKISAEAIVQSTITSKTLVCGHGATISGKFQVIGEGLAPESTSLAGDQRSQQTRIVPA